MDCVRGWRTPDDLDLEAKVEADRREEEEDEMERKENAGPAAWVCLTARGIIVSVRRGIYDIS